MALITRINSNCKYLRADKKYLSLYFTTIIKNEKERQSTYKRLEEETKKLMERYFKIIVFLEEISDINLKRLRRIVRYSNKHYGLFFKTRP